MFMQPACTVSWLAPLGLWLASLGSPCALASSPPEPRTTPVAEVGDGQLGFLPGVWEVRGWARADASNRIELDAVVVVAPWSDGLSRGYRQTFFARSDWHAGAASVAGTGSPGVDPIGTGYWLWDGDAGGWCSLASWRPDYHDRALVFETRGATRRAAPTAGSDNFGTFEQAVWFDGVGADVWEFGVHRRYADGAAVDLCRVEADRIGGAPDPIEELVAGGEAVQVTTLMEGFGGSRALALDPAGTLYFGADQDGSGDVPIVARSPDGELRTVAAGLAPAGLVWRDGSLWVHAHDVEGGRVVRIDAAGVVEEIGALGGDPLAVDPEGNAYTVIGTEVLRLTRTGEVETWIDSESLAGAFALTWDDRSSSLITGIWKSGRIYRLRHGREPELIGRVPGSGRGRCAWITMDGADVLATSFGGSRVYRLRPDGDVELVAGFGLIGDVDGAGREARFHNPNGIAVSADGKTVYVAEIRPGPGGPFTRGRLRRIDLERR